MTPADASLNKRRATRGERLPVEDAAALSSVRGRHSCRIRVSHARKGRTGLIRLTFRLRADLGRSEGDGLEVTSFSHDEEELRRVNTVLDDARSAKLGSDASATPKPPQHDALPSATRAASQRRLTTGRPLKGVFQTVVWSCSARFAGEYSHDPRRRCVGSYLG
jgi:hypothetical protein